MAQGNRVGMVRLPNARRAMEAFLENPSPGYIPTRALEWQQGKHMGTLLHERFSVCLGLQDALASTQNDADSVQSTRIFSSPHCASILFKGDGEMDFEFKYAKLNAKNVREVTNGRA